MTCFKLFFSCITGCNSSPGQSYQATQKKSGVQSRKITDSAHHDRTCKHAESIKRLKNSHSGSFDPFLHTGDSKRHQQRKYQSTAKTADQLGSKKLKQVVDNGNNCRRQSHQ